MLLTWWWQGLALLVNPKQITTDASDDITTDAFDLIETD